MVLCPWTAILSKSPVSVSDFQLSRQQFCLRATLALWAFRKTTHLCVDAFCLPRVWWGLLTVVAAPSGPQYDVPVSWLTPSWSICHSHPAGSNHSARSTWTTSIKCPHPRQHYFYILSFKIGRKNISNNNSTGALNWSSKLFCVYKFSY